MSSVNAAGKVGFNAWDEENCEKSSRTNKPKNMPSLFFSTRTKGDPLRAI